MDDIPDYGSAFVCGKSRFESEKFHVKNDKILEISCGDEHTGVVTESGRVFMFGSNNWGQLGLGHENHVEKPSCIKSLKTDRVKLIACGRYHTVVASESGNIYTFGCNSESQLGLGDNANDSFYNSPQRLRSLEQQEWRALAAGSGHSCALSESGELWVWGVNDNYELGLPSVKEQRTPRRVDLSTKIVYVSCGLYHTAIITKKGQLLTTGSNEYGQLGYSDNSKTFELVDSFDEPVKTVACGGAHTVVVTRDGRGYTFGDGSKGQLGLGQEQLKTVRPRPIKFFDKMRLAYASAGECHTAFITENGRFYACGDNRYGKLGLNQKKYTAIQFIPKLVRKYRALKVLDVSCGGCHMILIGKANPNYRSSEDEFSSEPESTLDRRSSGRNSMSARIRDLDMDDPLKFRGSKMVTTISSNRPSNRHNLSDSDENERTFNRTHTLTKDNTFVPLSDVNMRKSLADERNKLSKRYGKDSDDDGYERINRNRRRDDYDYDDYGRGKKSNLSDDSGDERLNSYRRTNAVKPSVFSARNQRRYSSDEDRDTAQRLRNNPYDSDSRYPASSKSASAVRKPSNLDNYRRTSPTNYNRSSKTRYSDDDEKPNYQVVEYIPPSRRGQSGNLTNRSNYSTTSSSSQPDKKEKKIKICTVL